MKVLTGLIVAVLLAAGLVSAPAATAATSAPYPGSVTTYCHAKLSKTVYHRGVHPRMRFRVTAAGYSPRPAYLRVLFKRNGVKVATQYFHYKGGTQGYNLRAFNRRGHYTVRVRADFSKTSIYKDCLVAKRYRVIR